MASRRKLGSNRPLDPERGAGWQQPERGSDPTRSIAAPPSAGSELSPKRSRDLQDLTPTRTERVLPGWLTPLLAVIFGVVVTSAVAAGTDVFNAGPSDTDVTVSYNDGFGAGSQETRDELEADFIGRANALTDEQIRETEFRGMRATSIQTMELRNINFNEGFTVGYAQGVNETERRAAQAAEAAAEEAAVADAGESDGGESDDESATQ